MIVPISDNGRKFGYLFWPKRADEEVRALLSGAQTVEVTFNGVEIGTKTVDWGRRRISVGPKVTRELPETAREFDIAYSSPKLTVTSR